MPMRYDIDEVAGIVKMVGSGTLTDEEMLACVRHLRGDSRLRRGMPTLSDMRGVSELAITGAGLRQMLALMAGTNADRGPAKAAIVADEDISYGMARMLSLMGENLGAEPRFRAFRDMEHALAWLQRPRD